MRASVIFITLSVAVTTGLTACAPQDEANSASKDLVLYSGRSKSLVDPIVRQFEKETGIVTTVKYGSTSQLAVAIQEEGELSPADVFWAQDAGALGALTESGSLAPLPDASVGEVPRLFRHADSAWVATSGRARVLAYSPERVSEKELPRTVFDLVNPLWKGRVGWAPTNGSFHAFVSAMIVEQGEDKTRQWLVGMKENGTKSYAKNTPIIEAIAAGEIDLGLPNHYYLLRFKAADENYPVAQTFFKPKDIGNLVNVAGVGVLKTSRNQEIAKQFVDYLLSDKAQQYFTSQIFEYPVTGGVIANEQLVDLDELVALAPEVDLEQIDELKNTLKLLTEVGLI